MRVRFPSPAFSHGVVVTQTMAPAPRFKSFDTTADRPRKVEAMLNAHKVGLGTAVFLAGWHVFWVLLVLLGFAQPLINFIFWAHMIQPIYVTKPFDPVAAGVLIVLTAVTGYAFGFIAATIWNRVRGT
jgi:hypothetical protein